MRVIAGSARSLQLKSVPGETTRPTLDRIKETLFNIIQADVPDCEFLDLFAGSGAIGIEALSRGAKRSYFVEYQKAAVQVIKENLQHTKFTDRAEVLAMDATAAVRSLESRHGAFDLIFMDPPYGQDLERGVFAALAKSTLVSENTRIIVEEDLDCDLSYVSEYGFTLERVKEYKTNQHIFIRRR